MQWQHQQHGTLSNGRYVPVLRMRKIGFVRRLVCAKLVCVRRFCFQTNLMSLVSFGQGQSEFASLTSLTQKKFLALDTSRVGDNIFWEALKRRHCWRIKMADADAVLSNLLINCDPATIKLHNLKISETMGGTQEARVPVRSMPLRVVIQLGTWPPSVEWHWMGFWLSTNR